jgi:hypothetical protein
MREDLRGMCQGLRARRGHGRLRPRLPCLRRKLLEDGGVSEDQIMKSAYASLGLQTIVSGIIMYLVMFAMIDTLSSFYNNLNMFYMTLMMVAPMVVLMILAMMHMFPLKGANMVLIAVAVIAFLGSFALIRTQATIGNMAFVRSMIPHHSGAILMCQKANVTDAELKALCGEIIKSQQQEIDQMKSIMARLNK